MKFLILFALAFALVSAVSRLTKDPVLQNEGRIVNGIRAAPGQFKYMVSILLKSERWYGCGGSLIDKNWILTDAHSLIGVSSGVVYLGTILSNHAEITYNVTGRDIFPHPGWDPATVTNDIGLIRIPTTTESTDIGIVRIPSNNHNNYLGDTVVIPGFGKTSDDDTEASDFLLYAVLKVSPAKLCVKQYGVFSGDLKICVATPRKISPCYGDSGSPLVLEEQNLQIGVMSHGYNELCEQKYPVVFTRVSAYLDFIHSRIGHHS